LSDGLWHQSRPGRGNEKKRVGEAGAIEGDLYFIQTFIAKLLAYQ
jgi:hypothetical protein